MKQVREIEKIQNKKVVSKIEVTKPKDINKKNVVLSINNANQNEKLQNFHEVSNNAVLLGDKTQGGELPVLNTKSIILCNNDAEVKRYAEIIKNSDMRPFAVVRKREDVMKKKKLTFWNVFLCVLVGLVLGFVNGFLGGGGGMLCVPLLVFALGLPDKRAHATAILVMLPISLVSFVVYALNMEIEWMLALWVTLGSVAGGLLGSILLKKLSNAWLRAIFALIMIGAGVRMVI